MNDDSVSADRSPTGAKRWIAAVLLWGGLACFTAYHFIPSFGSARKGWIIWPAVADVVLDSSILQDPEDLIIVASLLTLALLITASPFLQGVFLKSRLAWSLASLMSGISTAPLWFMLLVRHPPPTFGPGGWCLLFAPALNFAGLLMLRGVKNAVGRGEAPPV